MGMEQWWNDAEGRNLKYQEKNVAPATLCPQKIPHGLVWDLT
jgi:hypothetical protein